MFDLGLHLKKHRKSRNLTQEKLGKMINRSKSVISNYENNLKTPSIDTFQSLAKIYNVSIDYLVGLDKQQKISIESLSIQQQNIIQTILIEFESNTTMYNGLSPRQQDILNCLIKEFLK